MTQNTNNKLTCYYKFPLHPHDIFLRTPTKIDEFSRKLRAGMISRISLDSIQLYKQGMTISEINKKLNEDSHIETDSEGNIIRYIPYSEHVLQIEDSKIYKLGYIRAIHWINMKI